MPSLYQVGKPYSTTKKHWPEGIDYNFRSGQHELRLFFRSPLSQEITAIKNGPAQFALSVIGDIIFFCFKFGDLEWSDCGFSIHLVPDNERTLPDIPKTNQERALLSTLLIDAETGILRVIRATTFSSRFTRILHQAIIDQAGRPYPGDNEYQRQIDQIYQKYRSKDLAKNHALARCRGGE